MLEYKLIKFVEVNDWDNLVKETYGNPYNFQQQDGCKERQIVDITVPTYEEDCEDSDERVSFETWLARDPNEPIPNEKYEWQRKLYWERNFYPNINMLINDLYSRNLLEEGNYKINIDW